MIPAGVLRTLSLSLPVLLTLAVTHLWINLRQPTAYMDELFHVPQAVVFCTSLKQKSIPVYSPKLTTPPGPYILSAALSPLFGCSTEALRLQAALAVAFCIPALAAVSHVLLGRNRSALLTDIDAWRIAVALVSHPPLLFSGALYYTDAFAVLFLSICWALSLRNLHILSALAGIISAGMRQTSALWHALFALHGLFHAARRGVSPVHLLRAAAPHALAGALYMSLFVWNGRSVVLGDHEHHVASAHWAMLPYFSAYRAIFSFPLLLSALLSALHLILLAPRSTIIIFVMTFAIVRACVVSTGAYVHPFAMADNRHYVFYLYRRILHSARVRHALVFPYVAALLLPLAPSVEALLLGLKASSTCATPTQPRGARERIGIWAARDGVAELTMQIVALVVTAVCVVPAQLLEPRYFIQGYIVTIMLFLTSKRAHFGNYQMRAFVVLNLAVHLFLVYVFAERPFDRPPDPHMPRDLSPGRFLY